MAALNGSAIEKSLCDRFHIDVIRASPSGSCATILQKAAPIYGRRGDHRRT